MRDPLLLDATAQLKLLHGGRIGALELLDAHLARARQRRDLNAVIRLDTEAARTRAQAFDERRTAFVAAGGDPSELATLEGLPMTVKDTFDVDGMAASSGIARLAHRPAGDADAVGRVRTVGANIWGKTNTPPMAADWQTAGRDYGVTNNPWDPGRTPGGSSGGAAAALAAGITPLEIGSDIGGSLRVPASFCGVFSHKSTFGLVSQKGHVPPRPGWAAERDLNVIGPMARSARDLRLLLSILSPSPIQARAPAANLVGLRVGLWLDEPAFALDVPVRNRVIAFASALAQEGAQVVPLDSPVHAGALLEAYSTLLLSVLSTDFPAKRQAALERGRGLAKLARALGLGGDAPGRALAAAATHREWLEADNARSVMQEAIGGAFAVHDVIIAPIAPVAAFPHDARPFERRSLALADGRRIPYGAMGQWIALATALGLPATTVPAGRTAEGLPVGVQIIGPAGGDSRTLSVAQAVEERIGGFEAPPAPRADKAAETPERPQASASRRS